MASLTAPLIGPSDWPFLLCMQAKERMVEAWTVLDFNKDGSITVKDFETRPVATDQATKYFKTLANYLDEDHDGTITQADFEIGLKRHAVKSLDSSVFPSFKSSDATSSQVGGSPGRLQKFQTAANECIVEACRTIVQHPSGVPPPVGAAPHRRRRQRWCGWPRGGWQWARLVQHLQKKMF